MEKLEYFSKSFTYAGGTYVFYLTKSNLSSKNAFIMDVEHLPMNSIEFFLRNSSIIEMSIYLYITHFELAPQWLEEIRLKWRLW